MNWSADSSVYREGNWSGNSSVHREEKNSVNSWFEIYYCLTRELGPRDRFLRTHKLRVYRHKSSLHWYFSEIVNRINSESHMLAQASRQSATGPAPGIYLAYEHIPLRDDQLQELWAPQDSNIIRSLGSPDHILNPDYELKGNEQLVVITEPPKPALLYQWGVSCTPPPMMFPYHPRRWLSLCDLEPILSHHPTELREQRRWELVRYHLEERHRFLADPVQKKGNLMSSHLEGTLWENWVLWHQQGRKKGQLKILDELDILGVTDRIVLIRKPSPKGFLPYKAAEFFALEVRCGSEEAAMKAVIEQDPKICEGSRSNLPLGSKIHASLAYTDKMIRPDLTKGECCACCGSKWHFAEFCEMNRLEGQKQKVRLIGALPTGIPKTFFKEINREDKTSLLEKGHKLYYDPDEQVSHEARTLFVSTKHVDLENHINSDDACQDHDDDTATRGSKTRMIVDENADDLSFMLPTEPEHCFVILFEKDGLPIYKHNWQWLPPRSSRYSMCNFGLGVKSIMEIFSHVLKTALLQHHKTFTIVFIDWLCPDHESHFGAQASVDFPTEYRSEWYGDFIGEGDKSAHYWDVVVPAPVSSPFIANRDGCGSGVAITRWSYQGAIALYRNLSRNQTTTSFSNPKTLTQTHPQEKEGRMALQQAQMLNTLEWEMSKMARKRNWKILSVPF